MRKNFIIIIGLLFTVSIAFAQENAASLRAENLPLQVEFFPEGGFFEDNQVVELMTLGARIYYTTNGEKPQIKSSHRYRGPILVDKTTIIRAIAIKGKERSFLISHSYFLNEPESTFPIVSISLDSEIFFNPDKGLFMKGSNAIDSIWKKPGANFWSRKEIPVSVEIFENNGETVYRSLSGLRLFGGMSRLFPQKSMAIVARKRYGEKRIKHKIFGRGELKKFKFLVLRNSGSDFGKTHFRDGLMTSLVDDLDLEKQAFQPAHVYINGEYWGIFNIREKINRYFVEGHSEYDKDSIDLIEHRLNRKRGSKRHYMKLIDFIENNDLSDPANYAWVQSQMEVENFMDYKIAQIYFDNQDAGGNIKFWRPKTADGKWRWILYDTDWGFGLHDDKAYNNNSFIFHTKIDGPRWPNPPWSTLILRKLLNNPDFQKEFVSRFSDYLNTYFSEKVVRKKIEKFYQEFLPEISRQLERWRIRRVKWEEQVDVMRTFAKERPDYVFRYLQEIFEPGEFREVAISATHGGHVLLNERIRIDSNLCGKYFQNIPLEIEASPHLGYRFSHWEGILMDKEVQKITLELNRTQYEIRAVFEKFEHPLVNQIMINEISANNFETGDWIEVYNYSEESVNLKDWVFTDKNNEFLFPSLNLAPRDYLILCEDSVAFRKAFPRAYNLVGNLGFGINKRLEVLKLFSPEGAAVDSVSYVIEPTDTFFTYNLLLPWLNNGTSENWEALKGYGTPNRANEYYVQSTLQAEKELWMQIGMATGVILICVLLLVLRHQGQI